MAGTQREWNVSACGVRAKFGGGGGVASWRPAWRGLLSFECNRLTPNNNNQTTFPLSSPHPLCFLGAYTPILSCSFLFF